VPAVLADQDPLCYQFDAGDGSVSMQGAFLSKPLQAVQNVSLPLTIVGSLERNRQCSNHFLALSTTAEPPLYYGQPGTLWVMMLCSKKYIYTPSVSRASNSSCADFGSNQLAIQLGVEYIVVTDDSCGPLAAMHQLPSGPLHIFLGALCDYASCEGGTTWTGLEIFPGNTGPFNTASTSLTPAGLPVSLQATPPVVELGKVLDNTLPSVFGGNQGVIAPPPVESILGTPGDLMTGALPSANPAVFPPADIASKALEVDWVSVSPPKRWCGAQEKFQGTLPWWCEAMIQTGLSYACHWKSF